MDPCFDAYVSFMILHWYNHHLSVINILAINIKSIKKIKEVMRFSGPRMLFYHPVLALRHFIESRNEN